jgi:formate hydrogenlyase subunit 4
MKQFVLYTIFCNVLLLPPGLASTGSVAAVALATVLLFAKMMLVALVVIAIDTSFAKLRLYKITEYIATGLLVAVLAVFAWTAGLG